MKTINREQAIKYFEKRLIELQGYMNCIRNGREREKVLNKYRRFLEVLEDLKEEKEW